MFKNNSNNAEWEENCSIDGYDDSSEYEVVVSDCSGRKKHIPKNNYYSGNDIRPVDVYLGGISRWTSY